MKELNIEDETRMYLYDLMNTAREHGFSKEDKWELSLVTGLENARIQKDYFPSISAKINPEILLEVFRLTKARLDQPLSNDESQLNTRSILNEEWNYIIAYNPKRIRT